MYHNRKFQPVATAICLAILGGCSQSAPTSAPLPITGLGAGQVVAPDGQDTSRSVQSRESKKLLVTGLPPTEPGEVPDKTVTTLQGLKHPDLVQILPPGLDQVGPDAALNLIATPKNALTAGYAQVGDPKPVLALNSDTDNLLNMPAHWAVVGQQDGWVQILTPVGRGASLPSVDPSQVNHHAIWVKANDVTLNPSKYTIEVDTTAYTMTVIGPNGSHSFHIGVGKMGVTETPKGLCVIVGKVVIQSGEPGLLTNCQSEMIDRFDGAADAATAIHEYEHLGFDPAVGGSVSNGCMRIPNPSFEQYLEDIPAGTPVIIR